MANSNPSLLLSEQAYQLLETKIVNLELIPGTFVTENELVQLTGLGRMPVKEALKKLETVELIQIFPRKGILITPIEWNTTFQQLELYRALKIIQYKSVMRNILPNEKEAMNVLKTKIENIIDDSEEYRHLIGEEFYNFALQIARNPSLTRIIQPLKIHQKRLFNKYYHKRIETLISTKKLQLQLINSIIQSDYDKMENLANQLSDISETFYKNIYVSEIEYIKY